MGGQSTSMLSLSFLMVKASFRGKFEGKDKYLLRKIFTFRQTSKIEEWELSVEQNFWKPSRLALFNIFLVLACVL